MKLRALLWSLFAGVSVAACLGYGLIVDAFDTPSYWRLSLFLVIGVTGLALVFLSPSIRSKWTLVAFIWLPAVLMRLALLPAAPSDDINRYLWEGRLVAEGHSPYTATADAEEWVAYRDAYWAAMNHRDKPTAYPPLTELAFSWLVRIKYDPLTFKIFFIAFDLLTIAGIIEMLRQRGLTPAFAGFYAFNPVVLISFAGEAHFDILMLAALVWAGVAFMKGRTNWAVALASIASGIKWVTLPLIPFFSGDRIVRSALLSIAVLALPCIFFMDTLDELLRGLFEFGSTRSFNGPVYELLYQNGIPRTLCSGFVAFAFGGILIWRWLVRERAAFDSHIRWILGALIVLSPTVHVWYLAWILPFVCLRPSMLWLMFSLSGAAYFFVWLNADGGAWYLAPWQQFVFWFPFAVACLYEVWSTRGRVVWPHTTGRANDHRLAVVIPTLNVEDRIEAVLKSVCEQTHAASEVCIVDAGSTDSTVSKALSVLPDLRVVQSERGRGQQIAAGIEAVSNVDWVVVLHADAVLPEEALARIAASVSAQPDVVGGALGQRFEVQQVELLPIEVLNDLRAMFTRTAFGDQTQFFHKESALSYGLMPEQALMEDVESSWRVRECGGFIFLGQPARVSHRSWKADEWLKRFALVMRLMTRYRAARLKSRAAAAELGEKMYREYYGSGK